MAEGLARELGAGLVEAHSAGIMAVPVDPRVVQVMQELGIDIAYHSSKVMDAGLMCTMDYVITLGNRVAAVCPATPVTVERLHWPIQDPVGAIGSKEEIISDFRRARDEIGMHLVQFLRQIAEKGRLES
jgi:arsenate reductase